jgi:purine-binding chemotaxis protein CheW
MSQAVEGKYLCVMLGDESYGIYVLSVREIVSMLPITRVPNAPSQVLGVVNLRGRLVPVIDLRSKLMVQADARQPTCIVVVQSKAGTQAGLAVDAVVEVLRVSKDDLDRSPGVAAQELGTSGIAKMKGRIVVLLDVDTVLRDEFADVEAVA